MEEAESPAPEWLPFPSPDVTDTQHQSRWRPMIQDHVQKPSDCGKWMKKRKIYEQDSSPSNTMDFVDYWKINILSRTFLMKKSVGKQKNMLKLQVLFVVFVTLLGSSEALCPSKCSCDDETLRASCVDAGLAVVPIQLNPELETIVLRDNKIMSVHFTLGFYANLRSLDVSRNRIVSLGGRNFEFQNKLVTLNVSANQITNISKDTFRGLKSLRVLDLSENLIESLEGGVWSDLPDLSELNLARNKILGVSDGVFDPLKTLRVLKLEDNQLLDIPTSALRRLPVLKTLTLSDNLIESVGEDSIPALRDLKLLTLQSNVISSIHRAAFDGLQSLEFLDLSDNNLTTVPTSQLSKLAHLQDLHLSGNGFPFVGPVAFKSLFKLRRLRLCRLPKLYRVDVRAFVDNIKLESVTLEDNSALDSLPTRLFHGNPELVHLSVRGNSFVSLDASHFPLDQLQSLYISDNPLHCNCSLLWLWILTRKQYESDLKNLSFTSTDSPELTPRLDIGDIRCARPEVFKNFLMVDIPETEVRCDTSWITVIIVTIVVMTLFSITCGILIFLGKFCKKPEIESEPHANHHHHLQNGAVLMLMTKRDNMDGMDDFMLKTKDPMVNDIQYQHQLATWDSIGKDNGVTDPRAIDMYNGQYTMNGISKKPAHIVYV